MTNFEKAVKSAFTNTELLQLVQGPCKTVQELLECYSGIALHTQIDFGEVIGNNDWNIDIQQGGIGFGQGAMVVTIKDSKIDNSKIDNHHRTLTFFQK